jgi:Suppressor of fused protein (SUFU)
MFKKLFGKKTPPSEADTAAWYARAAANMERALGPAHDRILHVIIADPDYGPFNTQFFHQHVPGTAMVTHGLARPGEARGRNSAFDTVELIAFSRERVGDKDDLEDVSGKTPGGMLRAALNTLAGYAVDATVEPGSTLEFPADYDDYVGGRCFLITAFASEMFSKAFGLMLVIEIHRDEMQFGMDNSGAALLEKLQAANVYPYSDLNRPSVLAGPLQ